MRFEVIVKFVDNHTAIVAKTNDFEEADNLMIKALDFNLIKEAEIYDLGDEQSLVYMTRND